MPTFLIISLVGLAALLLSSRSSAKSGNGGTGLPSFNVQGKSGIQWNVQTLRVEGDVSAFEVRGGTQVSTTGFTVMRYSQNRSTGKRTYLGSTLAPNDPLLARARSDFGV